MAIQCPQCGFQIERKPGRPPGIHMPRPRPTYEKGQTLPVCLDDGLDAMTNQIVDKTLLACGGNVTEAAHVLGISRKTIYNRMEAAKTKVDAVAQPPAKAPVSSPQSPARNDGAA